MVGTQRVGVQPHSFPAHHLCFTVKLLQNVVNQFISSGRYHDVSIP